jgi:hypothetical protein
MSAKPKLETLRRKAQRHAFAAMWDQQPVTYGTLSARMVRRTQHNARSPLARI